MARKRSDLATPPLVHRALTPPGVFLIRMLIFLTLVAFLTAILHKQLIASFMNNPGLNGLIVGVLFLGIIYAFRQVIRLYPEIRWVNAFRIADPGLAISHQPVLLAPMAALLRDRTGVLSLSTSSMRSIMDSIGSRLDEARDTGRYLVGLLVFLGLLGTFWGLLGTISSIGQTIQALDPGTGDANDVLESLKAGLSAPLASMGTAFSASLFGLSGSLIVGFLDLQAGRAQMRFYTELENWLSTVADLSSDIAVDAGRLSAAAPVDEFRSLTERLKTLQENGGSNQRVATAMANLADGISGLVKNMRNEQQIMRDWVEAQSEEQKAMRGTLDKIADALTRREMH